MKKMSTKKLVALALLSAIVAVVQILGGAVKITSAVSVSLVLIPIVVGAAIYGVRAGALLGTVFGIVALINCINGTDVGGNMLWNANPALTAVLCIVKGAAAGAAAGFVFRLLSKKNAWLGAVTAAAVCPIVNTGIFLLALVFFYHDVLLTWANGSPALEYILSGLVLLNFVPELVINLIVSPAIPRIVYAVNRKQV